MCVCVYVFMARVLSLTLMLTQEYQARTSLAVQWLNSFSAAGAGSIPGQGTRSHMLGGQKKKRILAWLLASNLTLKLTQLQTLSFAGEEAGLRVVS